MSTPTSPRSPRTPPSPARPLPRTPNAPPPSPASPQQHHLHIRSHSDPSSASSTFRPTSPLAALMFGIKSSLTRCRQSAAQLVRSPPRSPPLSPSLSLAGSAVPPLIPSCLFVARNAHKGDSIWRSSTNAEAHRRRILLRRTLSLDTTDTDTTSSSSSSSKSGYSASDSDCSGRDSPYLLSSTPLMHADDSDEADCEADECQCVWTDDDGVSVFRCC